MELELKKAIAKKKLSMLDDGSDRATTYNNRQNTGLKLGEAVDVLSGKMKTSAQPPMENTYALGNEEDKYNFKATGEMNTEIAKKIAQKKRSYQGE